MDEEDQIEVKDEKTTLESAITAADGVVTKDEKKETPPPAKDPKEVKDPVEETLTDDEALSEEEAKQALEFWKALKDPVKGTAVVEFLAKQAGFSKPPETKKEAETQADKITDIIKEEFGEDMAFLVPKLSAAIKRILKEEVETTVLSKTEDLRSHLERQEEQKIVDAGNVKQKAIAKEFFGADELPANVLTHMNKLMDEINPSPKMGMDKYIQTLFDLTVVQLKLKPKAQSERIDRNRTNAPSRLANERAAGASTETTNGSKKINLDSAIKLAMDDIEKEFASSD